MGSDDRAREHLRIDYGAFASTHARSHRTHSPLAAEDARRRPMGSPWPPPECAPRGHSGATAARTPARATTHPRRPHRVADRATGPISRSPMVGQFPRR